MLNELNEVPLTGDAPLSSFFARFAAHSSTTHCEATVKCERLAMISFLAFVGDVPVASVSSERADAWHLKIAREYSSNTVRAKLCLLKSIFHYGIVLGAVARNPFEGVALPPVVFAGRIVSDALLARYIKLFPERMRRCLRLILYTGMRKKEAVDLDWREVRGNTIVLAPERTKNRKGRTVYLNAIARRCLGSRPASGAGRVFDFKHSTLLHYSTRAYRRLGCGRIRLHDLRHTAATRHYERNHDDYAMMSQFGWSNVKAAQAYHHATDARVRKSMARLSFAI